MQYFTESGAEDVIAHYKDLIGNNYYFLSGDKKEKLSGIQKMRTIEKNAFNVLFLSETNKQWVIYEFMKLNSIDYRFEDHENISAEFQ